MTEPGFAGHGSHRPGSVCLECERLSGSTAHDHDWVEWEAWAGWGWNPHSKMSRLLVCDVPDCIEVRTEPLAVEGLPVKVSGGKAR